MEDVTAILPNMVIIKIDNDLVGFPLSEDGILSDGTAFSSDYDLEPYQVIFARYDIIDRSSIELQRFTYLVDEKEHSVEDIFKQGLLQEYVTYILSDVYNK